MVNAYLPEISDSKRIIIFGAGKNGKKIFKYLKKIGKEKDCFFADNKDYGKKLLGVKIYLPEVATEEFQDVKWIISSPKNAQAMQQQLLGLGVLEDNIIQPTEEDVAYMHKEVYPFWFDESKHFIFGYGFPIDRVYIFKCVKAFFLNRYYEYIIKQRKIENIERKVYKYNVAICAIFLNEGPYLKEWIEYHRIVGVEHFYLYNNNSTDEYKRVLESYIEKGIVTLTDWDVPHGQVPAYKDCVKRFSKETRWIGFIDLDEFVVPKKNKIYEYLKEYENKCGALQIYWKIYGSSGLETRNLEGMVTEDFYECWPKYGDAGKCFYNTAFPLSDDKKNGIGMMHECWTRKNGKDIPPLNVYGKVSFYWIYRLTNNIEPSLQINHYQTKSYEEYRKKMGQTDAIFKVNKRRDYHFRFYDGRANSIDDRIKQYLPELRRRLEKAVTELCD